MGSYETTIDTLADELARIEATFRSLTEPEWAASTWLVPVDPDLPHWTVFELAGHFDISIGLTRMLIDGLGEERPARDRTSFFINPRSETGPVVYGYAYTMVEGKTPADMPGSWPRRSARPSRRPARCRPAPSGRGTSRPCRWTSSWPAGASRPWSTGWISLRRWAGTRSVRRRGSR